MYQPFYLFDKCMTGKAQKGEKKCLRFTLKTLFYRFVSSINTKYFGAPQTKYIPRKICLSLEFIKSPPFASIYINNVVFTPYNNINAKKYGTMPLLNVAILHICRKS